MLPDPLVHAWPHLRGLARVGEAGLLGVLAAIERGFEVYGSGGITSSCAALKEAGNRDPDSGKAIEYRAVVAVCGMSQKGSTWLSS